MTVNQRLAFSTVQKSVNPSATKAWSGLSVRADMTGGRKEGSDGLHSPRAGAGRTGGARNAHPSVKPVALMRYLCRLVTPIGGVILDPWMGSGTKGKAAILDGFTFIGIEKDLRLLLRQQPEYRIQKK